MLMSCPSPPRRRQSFATATDFATKPIPAAAASRSVLGTIGSAPWNVTSPPISRLLSPIPASTSSSAASVSNSRSCAMGAASAASIRSVSTEDRLAIDQRYWDLDLLRAQVLANRLADLVHPEVAGSGGSEQAAQHKMHGAQVRELVADYLDLGELGGERAQRLGRQGVAQPRPRAPFPRPDSDVAVRALVAAAGERHRAQRRRPCRPEIIARSGAVRVHGLLDFRGD